MLAPAASFADAILALHILAVVVGFGVLFAYPIFGIVGGRLDRHAMPWFHRVQQAIGRRLVNPGLLVVLAAGIYLASHAHQWKCFYVQWGLGAVIVLGGLEGAVMTRSEGRLAELAERDVKRAAGSHVVWSDEYEALRRRTALVGGLMNLIVVVTIFLMAMHAGA